MANAMFDSGREGFLGGTEDWDTDNIKVTLIDTADDDPNVTVDDNYDDIAAAARVATSGNLTSKTITNGTADAADVTYSSVTGDVSEELVIWFDSTVESTSTLLVSLDTFSAGMPVTPNGGDITVAWDNGGDKIFTL